MQRGTKTEVSSKNEIYTVSQKTVHFYRAMRCKRGLCCHAVSVCPSVRTSVCHICGSRQNE